MKLISTKSYSINYCGFFKNKHSRNRNSNSLVNRTLDLQDKDTIRRYSQLKKASFTRKLTDDEILILSTPWSIAYADYCERKRDYGHFLYEIEDIAKFEKETREKFDDVRRFNDEEIKTFIKLKSNPDFESANQIMRYIRLLSDDNGLSQKPSKLEAKYFAKKCTPFDEIKKYYNEKTSSTDFKELEKKYIFESFRQRKRQTDNQSFVFLKSSNGSIARFFTLANGVLINKSKSFILDDKTTNYDSTKRTTTIIKNDKLTHDGEEIEYPIDVIEILNDENGEPNQIIRTFIDKKDGIVYSKIYNLSDYPQNLDLLEMIKKDKISPSAQTTISKKVNGKTEVEQSFKTNNATLKRSYSQDENSWSLNLEIKDNEGKILYKCDRSFEKTGESSSTTTINGKKYYAVAQDDNEILVSYGDKEFYIIGLIEENTFFEDESKNGNIESFRNFCKTKLPADLMIIVKKLQTSLTPIKNELESEYSGGIFGGIYTAENVAVLSHEIGHLLSANNYDISTGAKIGYPLISQDEKLKEIYQKELEEYNKKHSEFANKKTIKYFSEFGGTKDKAEEERTTQARDKYDRYKIENSTGLEEIVAETMYLKTTPNINNPALAIRTQTLMMNFPLTIAYIANKIDENCKNLL